MINQRSVVVGLVAALLALAAGVFIGMDAGGPKKSEPALSSNAISRFFSTQLNDETGKPFALEQWRGKILVVNFWASWCQPCREEMPAFSRLQSKYAANNVQFVGIALDSAANVSQFKKMLPINYPLLIAESEGSELTRQLGNSRLALPYTVVFGKRGEVRKIKLGRIHEDELDAILLAAVKP